ncbi:MAG: transcription elongation factor GreA [Thermoanaerobacteraceae bacterium]|jgi:transcription elongation factor GreA|uniref:Transcription elongation factor GreA n=1 Tax=Biomaibacter acetigenes TaxID=2316383 RepID=A0A3G2R215_9FIRM|nr:transcription elongation factor GreA [Biomaibacter acetigenes]AYO29493.1 transcription elongation factor GreA [Biomaibacter acetigenes]MDK2879317.1 transcription elongation factor GreA [Thermoanaerobacteraceae bacterium]MDN5302350.1 transcription elongation factor GreA [Thermoanaerobacteraceae bacterium]RKL61535.1 transcription elongation factor GreA [Thermoanaerobacteraceae bacterium SP2]
MAKKEVVLTQDGLKKLEEELEYLKSVKRREIAARIKQAIDFGDISENSEYDEAKNEQAFVEGRIAALEEKLRNAKLIDDVDISTETVSIGSKIKVKDLDTGDVFEYTIVGSAEANPIEFKISNESPVGSALLGAKKGSVVEVNVPAGLIRYEIMDIMK